MGSRVSVKCLHPCSLFSDIPQNAGEVKAEPAQCMNPGAAGRWVRAAPDRGSEREGDSLVLVSGACGCARGGPGRPADGEVYSRGELDCKPVLPGRVSEERELNGE